MAELGLAVAPYYALASGFLTGKYRGRLSEAAAGRHGARYLDKRGRRVLEALTRSPPRTTGSLPRWPPGCCQAGHRRADRERARSVEQLAGVLPRSTGS